MSLEQKIMVDLKAAMFAKDEAALRSLRAIKAAILLAKTAEGSGGELKEEEEIAVIEKFLPQQLSADEIRSELQKIIASVGASSPADMGKVMGVATKQLSGKADGKTISALVKELLAK